MSYPVRPAPHAPTERLSAPVKLDDDRIRQYQLRPIPGQCVLFAHSADESFVFYVPND